ncbi:MAG TPA: hypothetical protein VLA98_11825 [Solirubrobacteraceae bacterium]|nr:hypothetical protein [Solirubrobacteraceae bacterium]HSD80741.1 hypothetical protein [Solirubrobacteraceae bacterium]
MDEHLKLLADAGLDISAAEDALDAADPGTARGALERAEAALADLRGRWAAMSAAERAIVGRAAAPLRGRLDAALARLPRRAAFAEGAPEHDTEEDVDPAAA